ncbi:MAG: exosortase/archaeosortase family protein [Pirellulales bacterium]|nr:exosortase/archaeosortase family protein [Pirellulales bacterium]
MAVAFAWAYWPTLVILVQAWENQPDYSHGFLVAPFAAILLWVRRATFPGWGKGFAWGGLVLVVLSIVFRAAGALFYVDAVDGWSMLVWLAGVLWLLGGWRVMRWALPAVAFLIFMVPLPYSAEYMLSWRLQRTVTQMSGWVLQSFGQPALVEGNTILIGSETLDVSDACSGLRIFMGVIAIAFAYVIVIRKAWWERAILILSVIPVALVANMTRIVVTALLNQWVSGEAAHQFTHDVAGYLMIPYAALLFFLVLWYLGRLAPDVEQWDVGAVVRREGV